MKWNGFFVQSKIVCNLLVDMIAKLDLMYSCICHIRARIHQIVHFYRFFPYSTSSSTARIFFLRSNSLRVLQMSTFFFNSSEKLEKQKKIMAITTQHIHTHNEYENRNNTQNRKRLRHNRAWMFCICAHFNTCNSRNRSLNRLSATKANSTLN